MLAICTSCFLDTKSNLAGVKLSRNLLGASLGEKFTLDLYVPSLVLNLDTL